MGSMKWTKEQSDAINIRDCNLLVSASAGSGKTAVLVERIIKMITDMDNDVDIDKLLVVTFTNAAAAEMRERVANAISKKIEECPDSQKLRKQLTLLSRANITTIHSFCLDVIKNNYHKLDLDPSFRIGDQTECILLKYEVLDDLFEEKYESESEGFIDLVEAFNGYKNDEKLKEIILNIYNFTMSGPNPEQWLKDSVLELCIENIDELNNSKWMVVLKEDLKNECEGFIKNYENAIEIIKNTDCLSAYLDTFNNDLEQIKDVYMSIDKGIEGLSNSINSVKFSRLKTIKKDLIDDVDSQNKVKAIRDDVKNGIDDFKKSIFIGTPEEILKNLNLTYSYMKELADVIIEFSDKFSDVKREKNILDFNDLEHLCLKVLSDYNEDGELIPSEVAQHFRDYFYEVLVDEYQDSNKIQERIINLVSRKNQSNPNVFMVGDVKQSIYKFRQAEPSLFIEKYNSYSKDKGSNRKVILYDNFRSREEIINSVNYIFKNVMSKYIGELDYTEEEELKSGAKYPDMNFESQSMETEFCIINKKEDESNASVEGSSNEKNIANSEDEEQIIDANLEGRFIARKIKELIMPEEGKKYQVLDKETGNYRDIQYRDIVILLRATKNSADVLVEELGNEQIPVYADTGSGYFESIEIRNIISLLKVIDNPIQDIPVISVLKSEIFSFTSEELVDIRIIDKSCYIYENIRNISDKPDSYPNLSDELKSKCSNFIDKIDIWRDKAIYMPIDEFIWYLYTDTSYYGYVGAMPNGALRQANLRILFQRAKQFEETSFKGLFNFINFINRLINSSGDMGSAKIVGENENVVRIMSIHKSKGLEFPVVFLSGTGKRFNMMDLNKNLLYHYDLGFGPDCIDIDKRIVLTTIAKESIKKRMKVEILSEEMRILYVALTRAREKLIIVGTVKDEQRTLEKWFKSSYLGEQRILESYTAKAMSYIDWIGMALARHNAMADLFYKHGMSSEYLKDDISIWDIYSINASELKNSLEHNEESEELNIWNKDEIKQDELYKIIDKKLSYSYDYKDSTVMKSNISVSELKEMYSDDNRYIDVEYLYEQDNEHHNDILTPKFLQEKKDFTPAERGTIIHFAMKSIDLSDISNIEHQLNEMLDRGLISAKERKVIRSDKIDKFFSSKIGSMMIEAFNKNSKNVFREIPFYTYINSNEIYGSDYSEKIRLQGIIDCFFILDDKVFLLDYKTDYIKDGEELDLVIKYKKQLEYYSEAIYKMVGKKVSKKYLYSFYLNKEIEIE